MAHFAEIDDNDIVLRILVVNNNEILDENGIEQEQKGIDSLKSMFGGTWIQASYTARIRKCYPHIGYHFDSIKNAFIPPKSFPSWAFNEVKWVWEAPIERPTEGYYVWIEENQNWIERE